MSRSRRLFSTQQESDILNWIQAQHAERRPPTCMMVREYACKTYKTNQKPSRGWLFGFFRRHKEAEKYIKEDKFEPPANVHKKYLTTEQELDLIEWIKTKHTDGFPVMPIQVREYAFEKYHLSRQPSRSWVRELRDRFPQLEKQLFRLSPSLVTEEQELDLIEWIKTKHTKGFPVTPIQVQNYAFKKYDLITQPSNTWFYDFKKRQSVQKYIVRQKKATTQQNIDYIQHDLGVPPTSDETAKETNEITTVNGVCESPGRTWMSNTEEEFHHEVNTHQDIHQQGGNYSQEWKQHKSNQASNIEPTGLYTKLDSNFNAPNHGVSNTGDVEGYEISGNTQGILGSNFDAQQGWFFDAQHGWLFDAQQGWLFDAQQGWFSCEGYLDYGHLFGDSICKEAEYEQFKTFVAS